jgi:formylglycine-generating enzyme required for sulfatase activity
MLMPKQLDGWVDLNLIDPIQIEDGKLQNVECFRLQYNFRDEQITLWIDKQSHLVRRIDEWLKSDDVRIERTTTCDPTIDGKITDEMLEFDPPAPRASDDGANTLPGSALGGNDSPPPPAQERDADAATQKAGQQRSDNQFDMPLCWCPAGEFKMGRKQLPVTLTRGFWMGKYEVTQAQYEALMGENPSENKGESLPVEKVEWTKATKFCQKFTELERKAGRLPKGWEYRLPTEAQWEYACRAGTTLIWDEKDLVYPSTFGDDLSELGDYAWYSENSDGTPHPGGQKKPNAWGLCDMYGNVSEWVRDAWQSKLSGGEDPEVSVWSPVYTVRGADFFHAAEACSSPFIRGIGLSSPQGTFTGFRVALVSVDGSLGLSFCCTLWLSFSSSIGPAMRLMLRREQTPS